MAFVKKAPTWSAPGVEPPESKKQEGWQVNDKPPAAWWNWFMTLSSESIKELQEKAAEKSDIGGYGVTSNNGNAYTITLTPVPPDPLPEGFRITIKVNASSSGAPTLNVNGKGAKSVLRASGGPASFKENGVYTLVFDGTAFILQGEGGEVGTATAADVLAGKTFPGEDGLITGTMPQRGNQFKSGSWSNPDGDPYVDTSAGIDSGYYPPGSQVGIQIYDPDLIPGNIRAGADIFGVSGKSTVVDTADAVLDPQYLLVGQSGYDDGVKKAGQMPNRSAENGHMPGLQSTVWPGDRFFIMPPHGFYDGASWVTAAVPGLTAANLRAGVNVAGLIGTLVEGKRLFYAEYPGDGTQKAVNPGFTYRAAVVYNDGGGNSAALILPNGSAFWFRSNSANTINLYDVTAQSFTLATSSTGGTHYVYIYGQ